VSYAGHRAGLVEPTPQIWLAAASDASLLVPAMEDAVRDAARQSRLTHCGAALIDAKDGSVLVATFTGRFLELDGSVPQRVAPGSRLVIDADLARGFQKPALAVTDPQGSVTRIPLPAGRSLEHTLTLEQAGEHSIEILAEGPEGIAVLAVIPVMVGAGSSRAAPEYAQEEGEKDAESVLDRIETLINEARRARKLPKLRINRKLAQVALAHSQDMDRNQFVAHTSKSTGEPSDRVARAGLKARVVLENIGRGYGAGEIHEGLMASPGHRANILHPDVREMGLGVVMQPEGDRLAFLVTELFADLMP
jgi:uncharacterized protein YkwD